MIDELSAYLRSIAREVDEILVVDGSPEPLFARHAKALEGVARHLRPHPDLDFAMDKVNGVITGVREARHELVVLADDDVRYEPGSLHRTVALLAEADLVRPQNYFDELPWHARWDSARSLLSRVFSGDPTSPVGDFPARWPYAARAFSLPAATTGFAFENLELMRTIRAAGGKVVTRLDLYVARRPPSSEHFLSQRVRHAYDDFAIPVRLGAFLAILPAATLLASRPTCPVGARLDRRALALCFGGAGSRRRALRRRTAAARRHVDANAAPALRVAAAGRP